MIRPHLRRGAKLVLALALYLALALRDAVPELRFAGWRPDFLIYFSALGGLFLRPWPAAAWGALIGLLEDLLLGRYLGLHLLSQAAAAAAVAWPAQWLYRKRLGAAWAAVAWGTLVEGITYGLLGLPLGLAYRWALLPRTLLANLLLAPLFYLLARALLRREPLLPATDTPAEAVAAAPNARLIQPRRRKAAPKPPQSEITAESGKQGV